MPKTLGPHAGGPGQGIGFWAQPSFLFPTTVNVQFRPPYFTPPRAPLPSGPTWTWWMPLSLQAQPTPAVIQSYDLPPKGYQQPDRTWIWNYNLNLIGQDQLPVGDQFTERPPLGPIQPLRSWSWSYNLNLIGKDQLPVGDQIYDLPPTGPIRTPYRSWVWNYNLNLIGQDQLPAGEQVTDLPPRAYPEPATRTWIQWYNLNLIGKDRLPTGKQVYDPPPLGPIQPLRYWYWSYNLNLIAQDALPVGKQVYDRPPRAYPPSGPTWTWSYNLNLVGQDTLPVGEQLFALPPTGYIYPNDNRTWINRLNLALTTQAAQLPANQYDWPNPKIPQQPAKSWTWSYNLNLIGKDQLPVGDQVYDRPQSWGVQQRQPIKIWTWNYNLNLIGKDSLPPGDQWYDRPPLGYQPHLANRTLAQSLSLPLNVVPIQLPFNQYDWPIPAAWAARELQRYFDRTVINQHNINLFPSVPPIPPVPPPTPPEDNRLAYNAGNEWQMIDRIKEPGPVGWR